MKISAIILCICLGLINSISAQFELEFETGIVTTGYNDVRIPGSEGTFISFSEELEAGHKLFYRLRMTYHINDRNELLLLYAPLKFTYKGMADRQINFMDKTFVAGIPLTANYKFNSYRLSYRYTIIQRDKIEIGVGLTLKIRDAFIDLEGGGASSRKDDLGAVPLINFKLHWKPIERLGLLLDGDALAAPQGRAEDVLLAVSWDYTERLMLRAGYRILEGGADNASVYTFSMFHYGVVGLQWRL